MNDLAEDATADATAPAFQQRRTARWGRLAHMAAAAAAALLLAGPHQLANAAAEPKRPNFLVILADDMGYSALGAFGGEISPPNLDALALSGMRLTDFHAAPVCSPSRAMLLTGADHHLVGLGAMVETMTPDQRGHDGYEGYLSKRAATIAEILHGGGYRTMMVGKWHMGAAEDQSPKARGFDSSYALLPGAHNHYGLDQGEAWTKWNIGATYREDGKSVQYPVGSYSSQVFTDKMVGYLKAQASDHRPFFAYVAYTEPHWPLQAPEAVVAKYRGRYDDGPAALRERRLARQKALGLIDPNAPAHALVGVPDWSSLSPGERATLARKMETYAAMVEEMDRGVGRLVQTLRETGELKNTIIIFMSDNGASAEMVDAPPRKPRDVQLPIDNSLDNLGHPTSFTSYGPAWAQAASAPSAMFKGSVAEGGIRVPAFVTGPGVGRGVSKAFAHITDISPTLLQLAGVPAPNQSDGRALLPIEGHSMVGLLTGRQARVRLPSETISWELNDRRAVRQDGWKAIYSAPFDVAAGRQAQASDARWMLFNLNADPWETRDLAEAEPGRLSSLVKSWDRYAKRVGVALPAAGRPPQPAR